MDTMYIRDLVVDCTIGTRADERLARQPLVVNIELECDLRKAGKSDSLEDTVNYNDLRNDVVKMMKASKFYLIERMADEIAGICLRDKSVAAVTVTVDKPEALDGAKSAAVRIRRSVERSSKK